MTCTCCSNNTFKNIGTKNKYTLLQCTTCNYLSVFNPPNTKELTKHYIKPTGTNKTLMKKINDYIGVRVVTWQFNKYIPPHSKILDFGCDTGAILHLLQVLGHQVEGIECNKKSRETAKQKYNLNIHESLETAKHPTQTFDVIIMKSVLEHLPQPKEQLQKITGLLKEGGKLILKLPNLDSQDYKVLGLKWQVICPPIHLNYFNKQNIVLFLKQFNYKIIYLNDSKIPAYIFPYNLHGLISIPLKILKLITGGINSNIQGSNLYVITQKK